MVGRKEGMRMRVRGSRKKQAKETTSIYHVYYVPSTISYAADPSLHAVMTSQ